jgi:cAMP-specific phosphodiesterase 4
MHSCDVSQSSRPFEIVKEWTYLLFEEFFDQGDLEKQQNLPITMLCDRATTNVASSQPGFIGFVPLPLFISLSNVLPELSEVVTQMKNNKENWKSYVETEENKKIYVAKK